MRRRLETSQTGKAFRTSPQRDWQIENGFFNGPIMARDQITDEGPERTFWSCFASKVSDRELKSEKRN